jgi:hypothetical protein
LLLRSDWLNVKVIDDGDNCCVSGDDLGEKGEAGFAAATPPDEITRAGACPIQTDKRISLGFLLRVYWLHKQHALAGKSFILDGGVKIPDNAAEIHRDFS